MNGIVTIFHTNTILVPIKIALAIPFLDRTTSVCYLPPFLKKLDLIVFIAAPRVMLNYETLKLSV